MSSLEKGGVYSNLRGALVLRARAQGLSLNQYLWVIGLPAGLYHDLLEDSPYFMTIEGAERLLLEGFSRGALEMILIQDILWGACHNMYRKRLWESKE